MAIQARPRSSENEEQTLDAQGLKPSGGVHWNLVGTVLIESAVRRGEGELADMGPFVAVTAPHTGRSPNDKFVVKDPSTDKDVDWGKVNQPLAPEKELRRRESAVSRRLRAVCFGWSGRDGSVVRSRAAEAGASAVRPAAKTGFAES